MPHILKKVSVFARQNACIFLIVLAMLLCAVVIRKINNPYVVTIAAILFGAFLFFVRENRD